MDLKNIKTDSIVVILLLAVVVGGFWMTGKAIAEKTDAIMQKVEGLDVSVRQLNESMRKNTRATVAPEPPAAPPAEPAAPAEPPE
jgi:outer membrane murein-binding lipoprotein Lpp